MKTGYTKTAGYCLTATALKNDMRLIAVAMGEESSATRNTEVMAMLDYGYAKYKMDTVANKSQIFAKINVEKARDEIVEIVPMEDIKIFNKKTTKLGNITYNLKLNSIKAPVKKNDNVGKLLVLNDGNVILEVPVTVNKNVEKANLFELYLRYLKDIISGNINI